MYQHIDSFKQGKAPTDQEYLLTYNHSCDDGTLVLAGSVINDVQFHYDELGNYDGYSFVVKELGKLEHTRFAWMIAIATAENRGTIAKYHDLREKKSELDNEVAELRKKVCTLNI